MRIIKFSARNNLEFYIIIRYWLDLFKEKGFGSASMLKIFKNACFL